MSEVLPRIIIQREEITMAVYRMQNLQLVSDPGEKRSKCAVALIVLMLLAAR